MILHKLYNESINSQQSLKLIRCNKEIPWKTSYKYSYKHASKELERAKKYKTSNKQVDTTIKAMDMRKWYEIKYL